jgi:hypothetical protein
MVMTLWGSVKRAMIAPLPRIGKIGGRFHGCGGYSRTVIEAGIRIKIARMRTSSLFILLPPKKFIHMEINTQIQSALSK